MKTVLKIEGMSCVNCVRHVTEALMALDGVTDVVVSLEAGTATVEHDALVKVEQMSETVADVGYEVV